MASTIQRDVVTAINSIQTYYLLNQNLENISDAISLNKQYWNIQKSKITFIENDKSCIEMELKEGKLR